MRLTHFTVRPSRLCGIFALVLWSGSAFAQAPSGLKVVGATSSQTQIAWTGTSATYTVQRAAVGSPFVNIATVATTSFLDTTIDHYLQYTYQILAGTSGNLASNQVTVGPPPAGLSLAAPAPLVGASPSDTYGENAALAFDGNGDPAVAFLWVDPNGDGDSSDTEVLFRSWNRASASWNPVVTVGTVGDISTDSRAPLSLAVDTGTNAWAVATEDSDGNLRVYSSSDGATWTLGKTYSTDNANWSAPSLALAGGNLYLSADIDVESVQYITGKLSDSTSWTVKASPSVANVDIAEDGVTTSLALDSSGNPAIAYWCSDPNDGHNLFLLFWRPATAAAPAIVTDTQDQQTTAAVKLTFSKLNPRIVFYALRLDSTDANDGVHFVRSDDAGVTWQTPVLIPADGAGSSTDYPFDLAIDSNGNGLVAFAQRGGTGAGQCGSPELSRSADLVTWTTCSPVATFGDFGSAPYAIQAAFQGNDKIYLTWWNGGEDPANTGVVLYREAPDNLAAGPVISNVQDAESAQTNVVPGEWAAIYGANLASESRTWAGSDFTNGNNLPTVLSGVSVTFGGIPAAVYYISPSQISVQVPAGALGSTPVAVTANGATGATFNANVVANAPSLYYYFAGTKIYAVAQHTDADASLVGDPAVVGGTKALPGETIVLYVNGLAASPAGTILGAIAYTNPVTVTWTSATGAATTVTAEYAGVAFAGGFQVNVAVPNALKAGDYVVTVTTQGVTSPADATVSVGP